MGHLHRLLHRPHHRGIPTGQPLYNPNNCMLQWEFNMSLSCKNLHLKRAIVFPGRIESSCWAFFGAGTERLQLYYSYTNVTFIFCTSLMIAHPVLTDTRSMVIIISKTILFIQKLLCFEPKQFNYLTQISVFKTFKPKLGPASRVVQLKGNLYPIILTQE